MKKQLYILVIIVLLAFLLAGCVPDDEASVVKSTTDDKVQDGKVQIVATLFPQYDFARQIAGDKAEVTLLLPPGMESHSYEPTPSDIIKINESDLFIYTGKNMEIWSQKIIDGLLRPIFIKMLNLLRINQPNEAAELFSEMTGTRAGRDFAVLLIKWDQLNPPELVENLLSYEKSMKSIRITAQKRRDEIISELIYFPAVLNILIIFINFIYVAYFIEQKEMLLMFM
jgi:hypothetical protein